MDLEEHVMSQAGLQDSLGCVDEAKIKHDIGGAWDKRSRCEDTVRIEVKSGCRDGPAVQATTNTQKHHGAVRAHKPPGLHSYDYAAPKALTKRY